LRADANDPFGWMLVDPVLDQGDTFVLLPGIDPEDVLVVVLDVLICCVRDLFRRAWGPASPGDENDQA